MKVLVFDVTASYGHFRVPYTVTSPLTFPVPSKTSLYGMLAAIVGLDKNSYLHNFQDRTCLCSVQLLRPVKKTHISENYLNTKNVEIFARMNSRKKPPHSQIKVEYLKEPAYRIYIHMKDESLFSRLQNMVADHKSVYTLSMGLSECLANFNIVGTFEAEEIVNRNGFHDIASIVPISLLSSSKSVNFLEEERKYIKIHIPLEMKPDRELIESGDFLVEANGETISVKVERFLRIHELNTNILMF